MVDHPRDAKFNAFEALAWDAFHAAAHDESCPARVQIPALGGLGWLCIDQMYPDSRPEMQRRVQSALASMATQSVQAAVEAQAESMRKTNCSRCGAWARSRGRPCEAPCWRRPDGTLSKRCRMHGGMSTGPKTPEGKAKALACLARGRQR